MAVNSEENRYGSCENTANLSFTLKKIIQSLDKNMENFNPATKSSQLAVTSLALEITC